MIYCTLNLPCPQGTKDRLCCIYCKQKPTCEEACNNRNKCCNYGLGLDGEKLYDEETGETVCEDIRDATPEQFKRFMEG
ncbi:hypothetical protein [Clostridium kluyveri]|uniref:Uncharacterized protein n=1 Tax=Clostridium kluyveri TaxID=1534 RepID=A0A1L5F8Y7_CLOKL|nr:hypothetical protein [Clostridium kluyveri]APM39433.1 hypothetical protein BS101_12105 [Clostridium kluyveri]